MPLPPAKNWISAPLLFPGLMLLLVNTSTSYHFYHVNSYKMVLMMLGLTVFALRNLPPFPSPVDHRIPWRIWLFFAIPLLATIPGFLWYHGAFNYNFRYELAALLLMILWAVYLCRCVRHENDLGFLFLCFGVVIIYNCVWSVLEKTGFHPLFWQESARFAKATFGHRNYYSGFLIILLPITAVFAVPDYMLPGRRQAPEGTTRRDARFFLIVFCCGGLSLLLAQTRAAIAAFLLSMALVGFLFVLFFGPRRWRRKLLIIYGLLVLAGIGMMGLILVNPDLFESSRFAQLFTVRAWLGRTLAWETALRSIMASPLIGYGLGSSYNLFFSFVDPNARLFHHEHSYNHVHSEILEYIQESGLIGLMAYTVFWGWLVLKLIRILRHERSNPVLLKLAIGVCGGFLAYHIHGTFSVAPRMLVTRLPLFTLIALVFIIHSLRSPGKNTDAIPAGNRRRILAGLPTLAVLAVVWIIFLPWAAGQWQFAQLRRERPSYLQIRKLVALTKLNPDIYALDYLSHRQIEYRQVDGLRQTLERTGQIIPHYRDLGFKWMIYATLEDDLSGAKRRGYAFQQRDRYHQPAIDLMMTLAARTEDYALFKEQFALSLRKHAFTYRLTDALDAEAVQISFLPGEIPLTVISQGDRLRFRWSEKRIGLLFDTARRNHAGKGFTAVDALRYRASLRQTFAKQPWFQLNILVDDATRIAEVRNMAQNHQRLSREWEEREKQLKQAHLREWMQAPSGQKKALYLRHQQALADAKKTYTSQMESYEQRLREVSDWDRYIQKQRFIEAFVDRLNTVLFPRAS